MLKDIWKYALDYCRLHGVDEQAINYWKNLPKPNEISDGYFLEELAWCIFNAGFRESVIRSKWEAIRSTYQFFNVDAVIRCEKKIAEMMKHVFNNKRKIQAVIDCAKKIKLESPISERLSKMTEAEILEYLKSYPYIGDITKYHIARNIGVDCVKPDRHLVRLSAFMGFASPDDMVNEIAMLTGEKKGFIDYILWQWLSWEGDKAYNKIKSIAAN